MGSQHHMGHRLRTERYRYVEWKKWPSGEFAARELYDLKTDPGEDVNLADGPAARALRDQLAARLHRGWRAEHHRL